LVSIIVDEDLSLRAYAPEDADELYAVINASRAHLHPWLEWVDRNTKPEHSLQFIQHSLQQIRMQEALALGIFYQGKIIGGTGMHNWDHGVKKAQIGYWLDKDSEGKGIINNVLTVFITYLFEKIGLNKIEVYFLPANKRSAKAAERLGFKVEGVLRQHVLRNGKPADVVIAGLLKNEWIKK